MRPRSVSFLEALRIAFAGTQNEARVYALLASCRPA